MNVYIDIETIPTIDPAVLGKIAEGITPPASMSKAETIAAWEAEKKPALIEEAARKTAFSGLHGHVICAAVAVDEKRPLAFSIVNVADEPTLLRNLFDYLRAIHAEEHGRRGTYIGHNIVNFDLRFLYQRAVMLRIPPPMQMPFKAKPWDDSVFDTMTQWSGLKDWTKLDDLCAAMGIEQKGHLDGSQVWEYFMNGRHGEIIEYCCADVERVRAVHKRMTFA